MDAAGEVQFAALLTENKVFIFKWFSPALPALDSLEELAQSQVKGCGQSCEMAESDLTHPPLQVRDMDFMDTRLLGKVDLPPAALFAKFADTFSELNADIKMHPTSIDLADALYLVDALSYSFLVPVQCSRFYGKEHLRIFTTKLWSN